MKKLTRSLRLAVIGLLIVSCSDQQTDTTAPLHDLQQIIADFKDPKSRVMIAAHRGDWRNAPENSIAAIRFAIDKGVDIIEIDLKKTKDGQLVLMHDETIDRTTDAQGKVSDWTWDSLKNVHLRNGLGRATYDHIPTMEEAMLALKGKVMVNLDKSYDYFPQAFEILEKTGTTQQAIMKGAVPVEKLQQDYGQYLDKIFFMPVISLDDTVSANWVAGYQEKLHPVAYEFIFQNDSSQTLNSFHTLNDGGSRIWVNSLWASLCAGHDDDKAIENPDANWGWLLEKGATILQTDRPEVLSQYLEIYQNQSKN